jgi:hypothetical protein
MMEIEGFLDFARNRLTETDEPLPTAPEDTTGYGLLLNPASPRSADALGAATQRRIGGAQYGKRRQRPENSGLPIVSGKK